MNTTNNYISGKEVNTLEYKAATWEQTAKCIEFRDICLSMQSWIKENTDPSRSQSIALTELETLNMWANKAIIFSNDKQNETN